MKKNSQIHLFIETNVLENLKKQAEEEEKTFSKLCREKLVGGSRLPIIEYKLDKLISILANRGIYKSRQLINSKLNINDKQMP